MSPAEREVVKSFGGWTAFMQTYGLKVNDSDDAKQGAEIIKRMAQADAESRG